MPKALKIFLATAIIILLISSPAHAQARFEITTSRPLQATGIFTDRDGNAMDYAVWVYGIVLYADENNAFMGVYNADTVAEMGDGLQVMDEIGEASQYDSAERMYDTPIHFSDGVGAVMTTGVGWVKYGIKP